MDWGPQGFKIMNDDTFMAPTESEFAGWKTGYGPGCGCVACSSVHANKERCNPVETTSDRACGSMYHSNLIVPDMPLDRPRLSDEGSWLKIPVALLQELQEVSKRRCGPDITEAFVDNASKAIAAYDAQYQTAMDAMAQAAKINGPAGERADLRAIGMFPSPLAFVAKNAVGTGPLDWRDGKEPGGGLRASGDCPFGADCAFTVTMCGECLTDDTPGNIALGLLAEYADIGKLGRLASYVDALFKLRLDDDQSSVRSGRGAGKALKNKGGKKPKNPRDALREAVCNAVQALKEADDTKFKSECPKCE